MKKQLMPVAWNSGEDCGLIKLKLCCYCSSYTYIFVSDLHRSDRLWESYIKWENEGNRLLNVTALYDRLLATPTQAYTNHFDRYFLKTILNQILFEYDDTCDHFLIISPFYSFQAHVNGNPPNKILSLDEFFKIRQEVLQQKKTFDQSPVAADDAAPPGEDVDAPPGEEPEQVITAVSTKTFSLLF